MTNPKIEKLTEAINKTKALIAESQTKLREMEQQKTELENLEIIALYRRENLSQDEFTALLRSQRKNKNAEISAEQEEN